MTKAAYNVPMSPVAQDAPIRTTGKTKATGRNSQCTLSVNDGSASGFGLFQPWNEFAERQFKLLYFCLVLINVAGNLGRALDCLLEVTSPAPVSLNRRGTKVKSVIRCSDGDAQCDLDGAGTPLGGAPGPCVVD